MMFRRRTSSIGVDVGSNSIKVVELEYTSKGPLILNAGMSKPLADSSAETAGTALAELVERRKFRSKRAIAAVSAASGELVIERFMFMEHATADIKEAELKERVKWEAIAQEYIPYSTDEAIIDCHIIGERTEGNIPGLQVFLVAVHRDLIKERVDILQTAGLAPIAIETDFSSVLGLINHMNLFPDDEDVAVIDIGATKTFIGIIHHRQLAFHRVIAIAGNHITSQIERRLRVSGDEAEDYKLTEDLFEKIPDGAGEIWRAASPIEQVIEERQGLFPQIRQCFDFYEADVPNAKLSKVFLSGGTSQLQNFDNFLSHRLTIPVENVHFLDYIFVADKGDASEIEEKEPIFATAGGLALKPFRRSY
jgi:type IV pilus assembly protein PilM